MAVIDIPSRKAGIGGIDLKAAGLVAATTAHLAVYVGRADFVVQMDWTACEIASNDEIYVIPVEANTRAEPTTWRVIGFLAVLGAEERTLNGDAPAAGSIRAEFNNPYDNEVRLKTWVGGTVATGINYGAKLYPPKDLQVIG